MSSSKENHAGIVVSSLPTSPTKDTYTRRTASLNAEAALKCLTEASKRMSPSTRAYYSTKRTSQDGETVKESGAPNFGKLTPTSACNDNSAVRSLQFGAQDSTSSPTRPHRRNLKPKQQHAKVKAKYITKTITVPQDLFVRRTANLNASACMTALLSPTKKAKTESNSGQNYAVVVPAQEDVEVDVVDVDPMSIKSVDILKMQNTSNKVEPSANEVITVSNPPSKFKAATVEKPSMHKGLEIPQVSSPVVHKSSPAVPDKTLLVPMREETVKEFVEEGLQFVEKSTQRRPSKLSRRENNGWSWIGKPIETVTTNKGAIRRYYIGMRRKSEAIFVRDSATFWSGESEDIPYVAKILSFWQEKSEMMCSVYWYYQLEDENLLEDELMASQHVDHNPVAAIIEKCYVLGLSEYCRYHAMMKCTIDNFASTRRPQQFVSKAKQSLYEQLQAPDGSVDPSLVYLCQKSYNYKTGKITGRK